MAAFAQPAFAHDGHQDSETISIDVTAKIAERCGIAASGPTTNSSVAELDKATDLTFGFTVDCNTPFRIGAYSLNGALRLTTAGDKGSVAADGFSQEKPYRAKLRVETDGDPIDTEFCSSRDLLSGPSDCEFFATTPGKGGINSGKRTAINRQGTLTVKWGAEDGNGPRRAAGTYQDTITVIVGVKS